ncbi:hypothetical protein ACBP83_14150 [Acinetobacter pseudolwoffii]|uniref:hypothetical protein n=1 Tax=Acinetobacter pseudolwoffii TaxID=2053287 RepID=UPI0035243386
MTVYSISYDLMKSGQKYDDLIKEIKSFADCCHVMDSYWLISTVLSAEQVRERLRKHTDDNDLIFVIQVSKNHSGWLRQETWNWINKHI